MSATFAATVLTTGVPAQAAPLHRASLAPTGETESQLVSLAKQYLSERADRLTGRTRISSLTSVKVKPALSKKLAVEKNALDDRRELLQKANGGHSGSEVTVTDPKVAVEGNRIVLSITEVTKLYFTKTFPGAPTYEEYALTHRFTFDPSGRTWVLASAEADVDPDSFAPDTQPDTTQATSSASGPTDPASSATDRPIALGRVPVETEKRGLRALDYDAMKRYAATYWRNYNDAYRSYRNLGGDCTNFVSQIMSAGGWARVGSWPGDSRSDNSKWFYGNQTWSTSYSWPAAENWYRFGIGSGRIRVLDNVWKMFATDVLQIRWRPNEWLNHTIFVNARAGNGTYASELYMTQHQADYHNKPLSSILAANPTVAAWFAERT